MAIDSLPEGFVLDEAQSSNGLPEGFVLDSQVEKPKISRKEAALTTFTNVPAVGMRAKAGIAAGVAKAFGGDATKDISLQELYNEGLANEKQKLESAREQYPVQSFATEFLSDAATGGKILKAANLTAKGLKTTVKGGALLSAAKTLGEEEDLTDLPKVAGDVATSAATGGLTSGVLQQAGRAISSVAGTGSDLVKRLIKSREAEAILAKVIKPEKAATLANKLAAKKERITLLPDIAGEEVSGLTRLLAKTEGGKNIINDVLTNRTAQSSRRVASLINNKISSDAYFGSLDDISKARAEVSAPLFEKAYSEGSKIPKNKISTLLQDERVISALNTARKDYGIGKEIPSNSVEALHGARQVLDDIIGAAKRGGENNKARAYTELRKNLTNSLYQASDTLKEADKTFAGFSALKNAQEEGLDFNKFSSSDELKRIIKDYSPSEKDAFKIGVRENLMRSINKTGDSASASKKIFGNPLNREKLKAVFNDPKEFADFSRKMGDEIRIFETKNRILGGSRTDINLADEAQIIGKVASGAMNVKAAGLSNLVSTVSDSLKKRYIGLNEENAKKLAQILTSKEKSIDALRNIASRAEKEGKAQSKIVKDSVNNLIPIILGTHAGNAASSADLISDANAGEVSEMLPENISDAELKNLQALQDEERRKYPSLYINKPRPSEQNYGGN